MLEGACDIDRFDGEHGISRAELVDRVVGKQALVCTLTDPIDRAVLESGSDLQVVATVVVGYNNVDVETARERGIVVTNTPGVLTEATADFTLALMLSVTRRLCEGERVVRRGAWKGWAFDFMNGAELRGKQLGIVGFGRIGQAVAARAEAFGMTVVHASRSDRGMSLDRLLATSDVVSLHVPLAPETTHLIDQAALARMKRSAYLVNTARGPVVDEEALGWALTNGIIAGAALDVYEREPQIYPSLLALENVVLAPHLASATRETRRAMAELAVRNVLAVLAGEFPPTPVL